MIKSLPERCSVQTNTEDFNLLCVYMAETANSDSLSKLRESVTVFIQKQFSWTRRICLA